MESKFTVFGEYVNDKQKETIRNSFIDSSKYGRERIDTELRKTSFELRWIKKISEYINEELVLLGIERKSNISKEQIHFFNTDEYDEVSEGGSSSGFGEYSLSLGGGIFADKEAIKDIYDTPKLKLFETVLHESVHSEQLHKIYGYKDTDKAKDKDDKDSMAGIFYRLGYLNNNISDDHEHFRGLNEAITQKITRQIIHKHAKDIIKLFDLKNGKELDKYLCEESTEYAVEIKIVNKIIEKIAEFKKEKSEEVWDKFKRGAFSGEMMHLREIEQTCGKGSLRVLAAMDSATRVKPGDSLYEIKTNKFILEYFSTNDDKKKDELASKILAECERRAYFKQRK